MTVEWRDRWQWWHRMHPSAYANGVVTTPRAWGTLEIYKHKTSGQLRLYSTNELDGTKVSVNGETAQVLRSAGRFGRLYIGHSE